MAAIGGAVVGHDALDADAVRLKKASARARKAQALSLLLVGEELGVGEPGGVVDGDVQMLPADAAVASWPRAIAGDAVADAVDPAELLGVDVDELAGMLRVRSGCAGGLGSRAARRPRPRRRSTAPTVERGMPSLAGDGGAAHALPPQPLDLGDRLGRQAVRAARRRRLAVVKRRRAARPIARQPFVGGALRHAGRRGGIGNPPAFAS